MMINMMLSLISGKFDHKSPNVMKSLYTALVRPHLEYAGHHITSVIKAYLKGWKDEQLKCQCCVTKCDKRLKRLDRFPLQKRMIKRNLFKVLSVKSVS